MSAGKFFISRELFLRSLKTEKETFGNLSTSSLYFWYDSSSVLKYPNNGIALSLKRICFFEVLRCKKLKDFMITPTCYSWRFCARSTYSFSKDDSPANVFEDNRMIWLTLRFLKSKKYHHFFFSRIGRMKFLPWERATAKQIYRFRIFFVFFFRPSCKKGNPRQNMFEFNK